MRLSARFALLPLTALLIGAAPAQRTIPFPGVSGWSLVVPADSPMTFRGFGEHGVARFSGRFVLSGSFTYGCNIECEGPHQDSNLVLVVQADPEIAALLPRVKNRDGDLTIYVRNGSRAARAVTTPQQRAALRTGQLPYVQGRISMVIDDLEIEGECDNVVYSARFVSFTKRQKLATVGPAAGSGCI
jgi:hypothetical protein